MPEIDNRQSVHSLIVAICAPLHLTDINSKMLGLYVSLPSKCALIMSLIVKKAANCSSEIKFFWNANQNFSLTFFYVKLQFKSPRTHFITDVAFAQSQWAFTNYETIYLLWLQSIRISLNLVLRMLWTVNVNILA